MEFKEFNCLSDDAILVRKTVFVEEQGFKDEFDETDKTATHIVVYDNSKPIGTCRIFHSEEPNTYLIGRVAVIKEYRGKNLGGKILEFAQKIIENKGGKAIKLHSQEQAIGFYQKYGYEICSDMEYEEYCPHYWMKKEI